jgi:hypothetical protein
VSAPPAPATYVPKPGAPAFFYFIPEDIGDALQLLPNAAIGIGTWITLDYLGIGLGPRSTADF